MARQERTLQICHSFYSSNRTSFNRTSFGRRSKAARPTALLPTPRNVKGPARRQGAPIPTNRSFATEAFATEAFGTTALEPGSQGRPELQAPELASQRHPLPEP